MQYTTSNLVASNIFWWLDKGWHTTISGGLAKLGWIAYILRYHNHFNKAKT
jgi:hypothetical protein